MTTLSFLPTRMDIEIQRGNDVDLSFEPTREEDAIPGLAEHRWEFAIRWRGGSLIKSTGDDGGIAVRDGLVICPLTEAETRRVPQGAAARYELSARDGAGLQRTWLSGIFSAKGGLNHD
jgi:hypothetical protein